MGSSIAPDLPHRPRSSIPGRKCGGKANYRGPPQRRHGDSGRLAWRDRRRWPGEFPPDQADLHLQHSDETEFSLSQTPVKFFWPAYPLDDVCEEFCRPQETRMRQIVTQHVSAKTGMSLLGCTQVLRSRMISRGNLASGKVSVSAKNFHLRRAAANVTFRRSLRLGLRLVCVVESRRMHITRNEYRLQHCQVQLPRTEGEDQKRKRRCDLWRDKPTSECLSAAKRQTSDQISFRDSSKNIQLDHHCHQTSSARLHPRDITRGLASTRILFVHLAATRVASAAEAHRDAIALQHLIR